MSKSWLLLLAVCGACAASEPLASEDLAMAEEAESARTVESQEQALLDDSSLRSKMIARINARGLALGPIAAVERGQGFDGERAAAALEQATGRKFVRGWASGRWDASSELHHAAFDSEDGMFEVQSVETYRRGLGRAADAIFQKRARSLFDALAPDSVGTPVEVLHVGATERDIVKGVAVSDERVGTKVFALRKLGGLKVAGNRLVASYQTDGTLLGVRGKWQKLDVDNSKLSSALTHENAVNRAAEVLLQRGVSPDSDEEVPLESFYEPQSRGDATVVVLRGAALVHTPEGRTERHEFDL